MHDQPRPIPDDDPKLPSGELTDDSIETQNLSIDKLLTKLNFHETPELAEAKQILLRALATEESGSPKLKSAWVEYAKICESIVEEIEPGPERQKEYAEAQIAVILHKALIFRTASNTLRYLEELDRAETFARNEHLDEVGSTIMDEIETIVETLELSPETLLIKLKGELSDENREQLRDNYLIDGDDLEDMINNAYALLESEDKDADEVLARLGIIEPKD